MQREPVPHAAWGTRQLQWWHWKWTAPRAGGWRRGEPRTAGVAPRARLVGRVSGPHFRRRTPTAPTAAPADQLLGPTQTQTAHMNQPHGPASDAPAHFMRGSPGGCPGPCQESLTERPPTTLAAAAADEMLVPIHKRSKAHRPYGQRTTMTQRTLRREDRVTVQGPARKPTKAGMSHRKGGGGHGHCRGTLMAVGEGDRQHLEAVLNSLKAVADKKQQLVLLANERWWHSFEGSATTVSFP